MSAGFAGNGIGLRKEHYSHILEGGKVQSEWFEVISENFMDSRGKPLEILEFVRRDFPVALHGVSLSIASAEGVSVSYLKKLKALADRVEPFIISDHLCWNRTDKISHHDLLPFPYNEESLQAVVSNVNKTQEALGRRIALENISAYLSFTSSDMQEWEFLNEITTQTGCGILLDVNNVYVSAMNLGFDPKKFLNAIPEESVMQIHLAGFSDMGDYLFDTHSQPVWDDVWDLFYHVSKRIRNAPVLIEWDEDIPDISTVEKESIKAAEIRKTAALEADAANKEEIQLSIHANQ